MFLFLTTESTKALRYTEEKQYQISNPYLCVLRVLCGNYILNLLTTEKHRGRFATLETRQRQYQISNPYLCVLGVLCGNFLNFSPPRAPRRFATLRKSSTKSLIPTSVFFVSSVVNLFCGKCFYFSPPITLSRFATLRKSSTKSLIPTSVNSVVNLFCGKCFYFSPPRTPRRFATQRINSTTSLALPLCSSCPLS